MEPRIPNPILFIFLQCVAPENY